MARTIAAFALVLCTLASPLAPAADRGVLEGSEYTNKSLGMKLRLPEGWTALGRSDTEKLIKRGEKSLERDTGKPQKVDAETANGVLLSALKYGPGQRPTAGLTLVTGEAPPPVTALAVLASARKTGAESQSTVKLSDISEVRVGARTFWTYTQETRKQGQTAFSRMLANVTDGKLVMLVLMYMTDADMRDTQRILDSIEFR